MTPSRAESAVVGHDSGQMCPTSTDSESRVDVRSISAAVHEGFVEQRGGSFLQAPAWARAKPDWSGESVGFFTDGQLTGVGLILHRRLPKLRRTLAYLPEGPVLDWARPDVDEHLAALVAYARGSGAFAVRVGPPVVHRRWLTIQVDARLSELIPDEVAPLGTRLRHTLVAGGWRHDERGHGLATGQPTVNFQLPLRRVDGTQKSEDELLAGMSTQWRRNITRAEKHGVVVRRGERVDLPRFHALYLETAGRCGFTGRSLSYFETMWDALTADRMRLYLAEHDGGLVAATTMVRVGERAWYTYGASSTAGREARGSNAVQWRMIRDANAERCAVYDLRGINEDAGGLLRFKAGTGGEVVAYVGEWDYPINRPLYAAFTRYLHHRRR